MTLADPLFVTAFTPNYRDEARQLIATLNTFRLRYAAFELPRGMTWLEANYEKPRVIMEALQASEKRGDNSPVVWLDADARVRRFPILLFELRCQFAAHMHHDRELLGSTLYFHNGAWGRILLLDWMEENRHDPELYDQLNLQHAVLKRLAADQGLDVEWLPQAYAKIFDEPGEAAVVEQMQASRRLAGPRDFDKLSGKKR